MPTTHAPATYYSDGAAKYIQSTNGILRANYSCAYLEGALQSATNSLSKIQGIAADVIQGYEQDYAKGVSMVRQFRDDLAGEYQRTCASPSPASGSNTKSASSVILPDDVSSGAWYADAVNWLVRQKYMPLRMVYQQGDYVGVPSDFHPSDPATRSEFIRLVVAMYGGGQADAVGKSGFDDIDPRNVNEISYFEQAAKNGWVKGVGSCYGRHPCNVQPDGTLNRAEAAAILVRAMGEQSDNNAPTFKDVSGNAWYAGTIRKAAARCILRGDEGGRTMRPGATMNRGEMAVMLWRASQNLLYPDCR
jgi:hypothetical protein